MEIILYTLGYLLIGFFGFIILAGLENKNPDKATEFWLMAGGTIIFWMPIVPYVMSINATKKLTTWLVTAGKKD